MQNTSYEGLALPMCELPNLLDVEGLSKYFNICQKSAYKLVRKRDFPSFKVNGKYRIIVDDLQNWMEKQSRCKN